MLEHQLEANPDSEWVFPGPDGRPYGAWKAGIPIRVVSVSVPKTEAKALTLISGESAKFPRSFPYGNSSGMLWCRQMLE